MDESLRSRGIRLCSMAAIGRGPFVRWFIPARRERVGSAGRTVPVSGSSPRVQGTRSQTM